MRCRSLPLMVACTASLWVPCAIAAVDRTAEQWLDFMNHAFMDASYEEEEISLRPGDTVLLYSDGISDAESPAGEQFGDDRLHLAMREASRSDSPEAVLDAVLRSVQSCAAGHPQADDISLLVVRYDGAG